MTPLEEVLLRVPVVVLLVYVPFLCYADLKWREIPPEWWAPAFLINIPIVAWFNYTGYFPPVVLVLSLVMCGIFWVLHMLDRFQGADFVFLVAISMSLVVAPFPVPHWGAQILFFLYLVAAMICTAGVIFFLNVKRGYTPGFWAMLNDWPGGVPMMLPISAALVITVVLG